MNKPVSIQLYSLREESAKDFRKTVERIAKVGYDAVEPAGLFGMKPAEFRSFVESLGMRISSAHGVSVDPEHPAEGADTLATLGLDTMVAGFWIPDFASEEAFRKTVEKVRSLVDALKPYGISVALHNHWMEFEKIQGEFIYDILIREVPEVKFEIDTYWAAHFGDLDPAEQVAKYRDRAPLLHIKDGPLIRDAAHVALGEGKIDIPRVIAAADPDVLRCLVVEIDKCDTDMFTAVEKSFRYLDKLRKNT